MRLRFDLASSFVLCTTYPNVAGAVGVTDPTVERYVIKDGSGANSADQASVIAIYKDPATGDPFGGYIRAFAEGGHTGAFTEPGNLKKTSAGSSTGVRWTGSAGADNNAIAGDGTYTIENFTLSAVDGSCLTSGGSGAWGSSAITAEDSSHSVWACRLE